VDPILVQISVSVPHDAPAPTVDEVLEAAAPLKAVSGDYTTQILVSVSRMPMPYPVADTSL
jgi:hypothetical protein